VEVEKLSTGTTYHYIVRSDGAQSDPYTFATAPNGSTPFQFLLYGDNRTQPDKHQTVVDRMNLEAADFIINVGDVVEDGWIPWQYDQQFFDQIGPLMATTPLYVSIGNHEAESLFFYRYFSFPGHERWYTFDYGNARFIALNSNFSLQPWTPQYPWFVSELQRAQADGVEWLFVFCHHPAYAEGWGGDGGQLDIRNHYLPLMEQYGVDAFLAGHTHDYERGELNGIIHIVTGGGGGPLSSWSQDHAHITVYESRYHYVKVEITGKTATFAAIDPDGTVFDTFTLAH
jgi:predicted phosphodiesterase